MEECHLEDSPPVCPGAPRPFLRSLLNKFLFGIYASVTMPPVVFIFLVLAVLIIGIIPIFFVWAFLMFILNLVAQCVGRFVPEYSHEPITTGQDGIRLLGILPGSGQDVLRCQLVDGQWSRSEYEALSYAWDCESMLDRPCYIGDRNFRISATLDRALRAMRDLTNIRTVWVDAICINKQKLSEKSSQVQQMQKIYQHARRVIVWLDVDSWAKPAEGSIEVAFGFVQKVIDGEMRNPASSRNDQKPWASALNVIYRLKWWERLWIIQEVASNQNVLVQCRNCTIPWESMCRFVTEGHASVHFQLVDGLQEFIERVEKIRDVSSPDPHFGLLTFMHDFRYSMATQNHDRLYALRGLVKSPQNQTNIDVDYKKEEQVVWMEFTKECLNRYNSLNILSLADTKDHIWWDFASRTWVPADFGNLRFSRKRWNATDVRQPFWLGAGEGTDVYSASGDAQSRCRTDLPYDAMIGVQGFILDVVENVSDIFRMADPVAKQRRVLREWEKLAGVGQLFEVTVTAGASASDSTIGELWRKDKDQELDFSEWTQLTSILHAASNFRRMITTKNDPTVGLAHALVKPGDLICVLLGSAVPYILRKSNHDAGFFHSILCEMMGCRRQKHLYCCVPEQYTLVGQAYLHESMEYKGDIEKDIEDGTIELKEFFLE